jgi:hypothetical protein
VNVGTWTSEYGIMDLVDNSVYRLRVNVTTDRPAAGVNPLWDIVVDNFGSSTVGANAYSGDYLFLDNIQGANAPNGGTYGRDGFEVFFAPLPVAAAHWKNTTTGAFAPSVDAHNDMRVIFRVLDVANAGYDGENDLGRLCMTDLQMDRYDLAQMSEDAAVFDAPTILEAQASQPVAEKKLKFSASGINNGSSQPVSTKSWTGGKLTVAPAENDGGDPGWDLELFAITPGDTTANPGAGTDLDDNWSIPWEADTLYKLEVVMSTTGQDNPPDAIRVGMDVPTTELLALCLITPNMNLAGTPKTTAATYTMFFYSHNVSLTTTAAQKFLRPRMDIVCHPDLKAYAKNNTGNIVIESMRIAKMNPVVD